MGSEPTDAMMDAACEKFAEYGIDFRCPWQCDLDDAELERYEALRAVLSVALSAQEEQIERLTKAVTACRPIIERLIAAEHNVETWGLKQRLAAIDAALEGSKRDG